MKTCFICLLWLFSLKIHAQSDSLQAEEWVKNAVQFLKENNPDSAAHYHHAALQLFRQLDLPYRGLRSFRTVYTALESQGKPVQLLDSLAAGLAWCDRPPRSRQEYLGRCNYLLYVGYLYQNRLNDYLSAKRYYEQGYDIFTEHLGERDDATAKFIYHNLGNAYTRLGDYQRAKVLLEKKIAYGEKHRLPQMLGGLSDLAIVHFEEGQLDSAKAALERELALPGFPAEDQLTARFGLVSYWLRKDDPQQAIAILQANAYLLDSIRATLSPVRFYRYQADWEEKMAVAQEAAGQYDAAFDNYRKSIRSRLESYGNVGTGRELGKTRCKLGGLFLKMNRLPEALAEAQLALQAVLPGFVPVGDENPSPDAFYPENTILEALEMKAVVLEKTGRLEAALDCYELIPDVETRLRETYQYEASGLLQLAESRGRLERAVGIARQLYEREQEERFAAKAFRFSELARGGLLLQSLAATAAAASLPDDLRQQEQELRSRMAWFEQEIATAKKGKTSQETGALEEALFQLKRKNAALQERLQHEHPPYAALRRQVDFAEAEDVPRLLSPGQALASFLLGDSLLHVFFFPPSGNMTWRTAALPDAFFLETAALADYLGSENQLPAAREKFAETAHSLYRLLLQPELENLGATVTSLVVVPDGALSFLPFEILLEQAPAAPNQGFGDLPFLIKTKSVSSLPSVTLAKRAAENANRHPASEPFAGFAPKYADSGNALAAVRSDSTSHPPIPKFPNSQIPPIPLRENLYDLPGAREEVRQINALTGGDNYSGDLARKAVFLENARRYRILHLAMHALPDRKNPALGRFVFSQKEGDTERDYLLYANELGNLSLQADLAVLSACNTGTGRSQRGEGVYSLARSFMLAGVPSVVMSLWRLPDSATAEVMVVFYREMLAGKEKAEALRLAKLAYLEANRSKPERLHPFFWGGLVLSGQ